MLSRSLSDQQSTISSSRMRDLWRYSTAQRGRLVLAMLLSAVAAGLSFCQPLLVNSIIREVTAGGSPAVSVLMLVLVLVAAAVVSAGSGYVLALIAEKGAYRIRRQYLRSLLRMPMWWYTYRPVGDLVSRATSDASTLKYALSSGFVDIVGNSLLVVGSGIALIILDPFLTALIVFLLVASTLVVIGASPRVRRANRAAQDATGLLGSRLQQSVAAMRILRPYGGTRHAEESASDVAGEVYAHSVRVARLQSTIVPVSSLLSQSGLIVIFLFGGWRVASGNMLLPDLLTFALFVNMLTTPASSVIGAVLSLQEALGALDRIREIVEAPHEPSDTSVKFPPASLSPTTLTVHDVSYKYPGSETWALSDVSFAVEPGERIALIGASGAGKTTLFSLLLGYDSPSRGRIIVNDVVLDETSLWRARQLIGHVDQGIHVVPGTFRDNVTVGASWATDEDIMKVLRQVGLTQIINNLPKGLDADVGENGETLSGGERQRLAIARALLHRRPILLLDEPSASLDAESENLVVDAIRTIPPDITVIIIAHRLSTIRDVDRVAVLDRGVLVATGSPQQVASSSPIYRMLMMDGGIS